MIAVDALRAPPEWQISVAAGGARTPHTTRQPKWERPVAVCTVSRRVSLGDLDFIPFGIADLRLTVDSNLVHCVMAGTKCRPY